MSALACFHAGSLILVELEFGMLVFMEGGKPENPETWRKTLGARRDQQLTQPTYDSWPELKMNHIDERQALSPVRHPCSLN